MLQKAIDIIAEAQEIVQNQRSKEEDKIYNFPESLQEREKVL